MKPMSPGQFLASMKRRDFLKTSAALALGAAAAPTLATRPAQAQQNVLTLLSWPGYADPEVVGPFEQANNVKVVGKEYTGGDNMLALLNSSPPGTFDLVLSDAEYVRMLREANLIQKLDPAAFPMDDFWPQFQKFGGFWSGTDMYAIMTSFGFLGMTYNAQKLKREEMNSYKIMWDPKVKKKVGMYDWYLPPMLCLSLYNGNKPPYDINNDQFAKLKQTLFSLKPQVAGIGAFAGAFSMLSQGEAWIMFVLPGRRSSYVTAIAEKVGRIVCSGLTALRRWQQQRALDSELSGFSDYLLQDIGVDVSDLRDRERIADLGHPSRANTEVTQGPPAHDATR